MNSFGSSMLRVTCRSRNAKPGIVHAPAARCGPARGRPLPSPLRRAAHPPVRTRPGPSQRASGRAAGSAKSRPSHSPGRVATNAQRDTSKHQVTPTRPNAMTSNQLHLSRSEIEALRNLQSGFYGRPLDDPVWQKLAKLGLIALREPPSPAVQLTPSGARYARSSPVPPKP